jgi:colanic acid biosynthesis glycosyl transferase WcaI
MSSNLSITPFRILIYGLNFSPEAVGIGRYSGEMAQWLSTRGFEVHAITSPPYYPQWRIQLPAINRFSRECLGTLLVDRCPIWVPRHPTGLKRLLHLASFTFTSFPLVLGHYFAPPDCIVVIAPSFFSTLPALLLSFLSRLRCRRVATLLHIQDFELDAAFQLGLLQGRVIRQLSEHVETWLLQRFDRVSTISESMVERLLRKGVSPGRVALFPNWVDCSTIAPCPAPGQIGWRRELGIPEEAVVLLYSGSMNQKQGLELLAAAAKSLADHPNLWWIFCGEGPTAPLLVQACAGLQQVLFLPLQSMVRFAELLQLADIHLLPQKQGAEDLVMPSKLLAMLASGRPVIATVDPISTLGQVVLTPHPAGIVTAPGDLPNLISAVLKLAASPTLRFQLGVHARERVMMYWDKQTVLLRFEQLLLGMAGRSLS